MIILGIGGILGDAATAIVKDGQLVAAVEDGIERSLCVAADVGVIDPQDHSSAIPPGVQPVEYEGAGTADVQIARRRRRKANSKHECPV